jgi:Putative zinc-finger
MNCERVHELLDLRLDGVLADVEREELVAHLSECDPCRERFESLRQVVDLVREIPPVRAPEGFTDGVLAGLPGRVGKRGRIRTLLPAAAAAALVLVFGALGFRQFLMPKPEPMTELAEGRSGDSRFDEEGLVVGDPMPAGERESFPRPAESAVLDRGVAAPAKVMPDPGMTARGASQWEQGGDGSASVPHLPEAVRERGLRYVVKGGEPDATVGLILAELQNRRSRDKRRQAKETDSVMGTRAFDERVESGESGEPESLVLYLTPEEVQYVLSLLLERKRSTRRTNGVGSGGAVGIGGGAGGALSHPEPAGPSAPSAPRDGEEGDDGDAPDAKTERLRVELRFDRSR